jgi:hypothetical protein
MRWTFLTVSMLLLAALFALGYVIARGLRSSAPYVEFTRTALSTGGWPAPAEVEVIVHKHGCESAWQTLAAPAWSMPGRAHEAHQGAAAVLYLSVSAVDEQSILAAVTAEQLGARPAGLMLSALWRLEGTDPRSRLTEFLDGSPAQVALALHALPLLTGVRLVESISAPLVLPRDPRSPSEVVEAIFGAPPSELVTEWEAWLQGDEATSFATTRAEFSRALLAQVDLDDEAYFEHGGGRALAPLFRALPQALPFAKPGTDPSTRRAELEHWLAANLEALDGPSPQGLDPRALLIAHSH